MSSTATLTTTSANSSSSCSLPATSSTTTTSSPPQTTTSSSNNSSASCSSLTKPQQRLLQSSYCSCSKFIPQAFNTNKCQQCFNLKDLHTAEALAEFSKSNRKVCKYGYLFIAPPDLEINKTKRWQWRFFIFYDDGELTYSLDDNPLTLPQGRINMSKCDEIAELSTLNQTDINISSYPYSLCLKFAQPLKDIYIAAGNYEEMTKWKDALLLYNCKQHQLKTYHHHHHQHHHHHHQHHNYQPNIINNNNSNSKIDTNSDKKNIIKNDLTKSQSLKSMNTNMNNNNNITTPSTTTSTSNKQSQSSSIDILEDLDDLDDIDEEVEENERQEYNNPNNLNRNEIEDELIEIRDVDDEIEVEEDDEYSNNTNKNKPINESPNTDSSSNSSNNNSSSSSNGATNGDNNNSDNSTNGSNNNNRRLSYKEDDLLRKQRLKENLNQLLIEYKHEEEANLKKLSKFTSQSQAQSNVSQNHRQISNRTSLDNNPRSGLNSHYGNNSGSKSSAFSLVLPPQLTTPISTSSTSTNLPTSSAFRPVTSLTNLLSNTNSNTSLPMQIQSSKLSKTQSSSAMINTNNNNNNNNNNSNSKVILNNNGSPSSSSSWSSTCSSSSSSSSNSPPKTRSLTTNGTQNNVNNTTNDQQISEAVLAQNYKKPCLISPRKQNLVEVGYMSESTSMLPNMGQNLTSSMSSSSSSTSSGTSNSGAAGKSLTILVRNNLIDENAQTDQTERNRKSDSVDSSMRNIEIIDLTKNSANKLCQRSLNSSSKILNNIQANVAGYLWKLKETNLDSSQFNKYWFSLNTNLCCLIYWNDKYEQDVGKFPLGKYELTKCCQITKDPTNQQQINFYNSNENFDFKICFHQNSASITLRTTSLDNKISWCDALKHCIDNLSSVCTKCKPKLVVNPMPSQQNSAFSTPQTTPPPSITPSQSLTSTLSQSSTLTQSDEQPNQSNMFVLINANSSNKPKNVKQSSSSPAKSSSSTSTLSSNSLILNSSKTEIPPFPTPSSSISFSSTPGSISTPQITNSQFDTLKQQYEKLLKENSEINSKFKLLEQIHLDSINEYDRQQNRLYNQLDDMHLKLNKTEHELDMVTKKLNQTKITNETSLAEIKSLNEQLIKFKETIQLQEKEIEKFSKRTKQINENTNNEIGWNKEVKNLDARINDVLGKIKERELNLTSGSPLSPPLGDESYKIKCERLQTQLQEAQKQLNQLKIESTNNARNSLSKTNVNLQDFSDDLAKVLMSKEEVITQLEKQLKDKEKQILELTEQLNEEISKTDKFQDAFNIELDRNNQLKNLTENLNEHYTDELCQIKEELNKSRGVIEALEQRINELTDEKNKCEVELKNLQEFSKNELETLQEEIKTLEYKLVHSQRQAQEYQSILEDMDMVNTSSINQLSQMYVTLGGSLNSVGIQSLNDLNTSNLQNRLKRNQSLVNILVQQIIESKNSNLEELKENLRRLQSEFDEIKDENVDLNDHIYSVDVYMREKEAQCDQLQKEKDDLCIELNRLKFKTGQLNDNNLNDYQLFLKCLNENLAKKTKNLNSFLKFCENLFNYLFDKNLEEGLVLDQEKILELIPNDSSTELTETENSNFNFKNMFLGNKSNLLSIKVELKKLIKYLNSPDLNEFNNQIVSYMAEQLIHKAALNGNLKFACELLRKKFEKNSSQTSYDKSTNLNSPKMSAGNALNNSVTNNEQEEKIFKLASELLLSDEDSLRKLSSQVLNEAQHLAQLNCALSTLKKLRIKYLKSNLNLNLINKIYDELSLKNDNIREYEDLRDESDQEDNNQEFDHNGNDNEIKKSVLSCSLDESNQMNYILEVIRDIFIQHKIQISEQLNEVHKLMSISSDDDLVVHLQNENSYLQEEINKLKEQVNTSKTTASLVDKKLTNWMMNSSSNLNQSKSSGGTQLRKFGLSSGSSSISNQKSNHHNHHHILTDLLSQDDTMC